MEAVAYLKDVGQNAAEGKSVLQALQPEQLKQIADSGETITSFLAALHQFLAGQTPEQMGAGLEDCGAPLSADLYSSARSYTEHLGEALGQLPKISKLLNDLRSQEDKCLQKQWDAYKACIEHARCAGTPESACDGLKPPGNWVAP